MLDMMLGAFQKLILTPLQQHQQLGVGPKISNEEIEAWRFIVPYYTVCIITGT